jgi:hypothetical protein
VDFRILGVLVVILNRRVWRRGARGAGLPAAVYLICCSPAQPAAAKRFTNCDDEPDAG